MPTRSTRRLRGALLAALVVPLSGPPPPATAKDYEVIAVRQRFVSGSGPSCRPERDGTSTVRIAPNDLVGWTNCTIENHTVTFDDGRHDAVIAPGQRTTRRFPTAGTYSYFCRIHNDAGMTGSVVVQTAAPSAPTGSAATSPPPTTSRSTARTPTTRPAATPTTRTPSAEPVAAPTPRATTPPAGRTARTAEPREDTSVDYVDVAADDRRKSSPGDGLRLAGWLALGASSMALVIATRRRNVR